MNNQRWKELVDFAKNSMYYFNDGDNVSDDEVKLILSVLKDNVPFFDDNIIFDLINTKVEF